VRAETWSVDEPGWLEANTVARRKGSMAQELYLGAYSDGYLE